MASNLLLAPGAMSSKAEVSTGSLARLRGSVKMEASVLEPAWAVTQDCRWRRKGAYDVGTQGTSVQVRPGEHLQMCSLWQQGVFSLRR